MNMDDHDIALFTDSGIATLENQKATLREKLSAQIEQSNYISRDLSWIQFNYRVLDQCRKTERTIYERLKFLAITASNLDEFFMIRVGGLYNYLDYNKKRVDYSGLREAPFRLRLFEELQNFANEQQSYFAEKLQPLFAENGFRVVSFQDLEADEQSQASDYFSKTVYPILTPMVFDNYHPFPILANRIVILGIVTRPIEDKRKQKKISFIQIPQNLQRFWVMERGEETLFVPIEDIIKNNIHTLFRNVEVLSVDAFRITRDGDFEVDELEDTDSNFAEEIIKKLKTRRTGRVVRIEITKNYSAVLMRVLKERWEIDDLNVFVSESLLDFSSLTQIAFHPNFRDEIPPLPPCSSALGYEIGKDQDIFDILKKRDLMVYRPFNSFETILDLLEKAADDPKVLAIKMIIYRLAKNSRVTAALLRAAERGKNVAVLFEVKARFDEENNLVEAQKLQKAGCFISYGFSNLKTHAKMMLIVRKEEDQVRRYIHMSTGNYNEATAKLYTDLSIMTTNETYANDLSEFFNSITGHSIPDNYELLLTAPNFLRNKLIELIQQEAENAKKGLPAGIVIKINSLQDADFINALYEASQAGVKIQLIIRGICCLRPQRPNLSENITVRSLVGNFLEHSRLYYFHNNGDPKIYSGSADAMVRSFDKRIESLFLIVDERCKRQAVAILDYNMRDNYNAYIMQENGNFVRFEDKDEPIFNSHERFYELSEDDLKKTGLF